MGELRTDFKLDIKKQRGSFRASERHAVGEENILANEILRADGIGILIAGITVIKKEALYLDSLFQDLRLACNTAESY